MKSIIQDEKRCFYCRTITGLDHHHCLEGSYRTQADDYGLWVWMCRKCHRIIQEDEKEMKKLRAMAQKKAMEYYGWTLNDWLFIFRRNFIDE